METCQGPDCSKTFKPRLDHGHRQRYCSQTCFKAARAARAKGTPVKRTFAGVPHENSIGRKVMRGDRETLKKLGLTHKQAKEKYREWQRQGDGNYSTMERWYRSNVQDSGKGDGRW